jgi:hypothetical protein
MADRTLLPVVVLIACVWTLVILAWLAAATGPGILWAVALVAVVATSVVAGSFLAACRGPRIQGTWWGELHSNYIDPASGARLGPIPVAVVVRQSGIDLFVCLHSKESSSITIAARRVMEADGRVCLVGVYRNEPKLPRQDTSRMHHGGLKLSVIDGERPRMQGTYWTDRGTAGEIELAFLSRRRAHDFREASALAEQHGASRRVPELDPSPFAAVVGVAGATHVSVGTKTPDESLRAFLQSAFTEVELRRFVKNLPTPGVVARLPGDGCSLAELADQIVDLLHRDGLLTIALSKLHDEKPLRKNEIRELQRRYPARSGPRVDANRSP